MDVVRLLSALASFLVFSRGVFVDFDVLKDFFRNKNARLTVNNCWSYTKNMAFLRTFYSGEVFKRVQIFKYRDGGSVQSLKKFTNSDVLVLDMRDCLSSQTILDQIDKHNIFVYFLKYLILIDNNDFDIMGQKLEHYKILPNCDFTVINLKNTTADLFQIYKPGKTDKLNWEFYGPWTAEVGLVNYLVNKPIPQRRLNLQKTSIITSVVVYQNESLKYLLDYRFPGVDTFTKQDFEPMMCVFQLMNASITVITTDNYGYVDNKTGAFGGLIKDIQSEKADVSASSLFFTKERFEAVDLIKQGNPHPIRFILRKPATSFVKNIFYITFNTSVWLASIVALMVSSVGVKIILNWETKHKKKVKQTRYSISDVSLIALEAICQQGTSTEPQSLAGRILAVILFGAFMFIYVSYSANIVVLLQSTTKILSAQELLESRIEVGGERIHYMRNYFEGVKSGPLKMLYETKIYPNQYFPLAEGMKKVLKGNFAFHLSMQSAYEYILQNFTNHEICGVQELAGYIEESIGYIGVPKFSPYKDLFKVALLKIDEYGLQRRTNLRVSMKPKCYSEGASFKPIGFFDCDKVLYILIFGICSALVVLIIECLVHSLKEKLKQHSKNMF